MATVHLKHTTAHVDRAVADVLAASPSGLAAGAVAELIPGPALSMYLSHARQEAAARGITAGLVITEAALARLVKWDQVTEVAGVFSLKVDRALLRDADKDCLLPPLVDKPREVLLDDRTVDKLVAEARKGFTTATGAIVKLYEGQAWRNSLMGDWKTFWARRFTIDGEVLTCPPGARREIVARNAGRGADAIREETGFGNGTISLDREWLKSQGRHDEAANVTEAREMTAREVDTSDDLVESIHFEPAGRTRPGSQRARAAEQNVSKKTIQNQDARAKQAADPIEKEAKSVVRAANRITKQAATVPVEPAPDVHWQNIERDQRREIVEMLNEFDRDQVNDLWNEADRIRARRLAK